MLSNTKTDTKIVKVIKMNENNNEVLNKMLNKVAKEKQYNECQISINSVSSDGANYTTTLYHVTISVPEKDDLKLFVKVAALGEKIRRETGFIIFEVEEFFYKILHKNYEAIEQRNKVPIEHKHIAPKFFASHNKYSEEVLILEDMTSKGYQAFNRFESVNWEYASKSVQNLAKLHALSISWLRDDSKGFEKNKKFEFKVYIQVWSELFKESMKKAIEVTRPENKERLEKFRKDMTENDMFISFFKPIRCPVIGHGDYRPSNLMHRKLDNGEYDVVSVDYQTLFKGNPILDLMFFIFTGSDKNFRKNHFKQTLEHYYKELRAALKRLNLVPDDIYSREDFDYELEKVMPFGLLCSSFFLLLIMAQEEETPKISNESNMNNFVVVPSSLYKERINDIIDDYIDMGLL